MSTEEPATGVTVQVAPMEVVVAEPTAENKIVQPDIDTDLQKLKVDTANLKEKSPYPSGYKPCVYVDSIADSNIRPLKWSPDKSSSKTMQNTEVFSLPALSQDVVVWVSTGDSEAYYKAMAPELHSALQEGTLQDLREDLKSKSLLVMQKIDSLEAQEIKSRGGMIITDIEARAVAEDYNDVSKERIKSKRDVDAARTSKEYWAKMKEQKRELADISKNRWVEANSSGKLPKDIYEWTQEGNKAVTLPVMDEYIPKLVIKVASQDGSKFYRYSTRPVESGNGGSKLGYLEEVAGVDEDRLNSEGARVVDTGFLRKTFASYGRVTQDSLRWQARDDLTVTYTAQREAYAAQVKEDQKSTVAKVIGKVKTL